MATETVGRLAALVDGRVVGDGELTIDGIADLGSAGPTQLTFVRDARFGDAARESRAGAILVSEELDVSCAQVVVESPDRAFARIATHFHPAPRAVEHRVHPSAVIAEDSVLEEPVEIGPQAVIEAGAKVCRGAIVGAGSVVGARSVVGPDSVLHARVVLYADVKLGERVVLHSGCVIGGDGFGFAKIDGRWNKVPQIGGVVLEDDVEIGANCAIDCGTLNPTRIRRGSKVDNLTHIGHNCQIGENFAAAAMGAFAGSTVIGDNVTFGGHVLTSGHLKVVDGATIAGNSSLIADVKEPGTYMGYPLMKRMSWLRTLKQMEFLGKAPLPKKAPPKKEPLPE